MGWIRVSVVGETLKDIDLELQSPITGENAVVQIKTAADKKTFDYYEAKFYEMNSFDKFFFIVSSPTPDLESYIKNNDSKVKIFSMYEIAELTISSGLTEWVISKTT